MDLRPEPADPVRTLPAWPLLGFFWSYGLLWAIGLGLALPALWGGVMFLHLLLRGSVRVPKPFVAWFTFLIIATLSGAMLDSGDRALGFAVRLANYLGATAAGLYLYNTSRARLEDATVGRALTALWVLVVLGGFLGVLAPEGSLRTPMSFLVPAGLLQNEFVRDLVIPRFAEVQSPWGSPTTFSRPSAPFPYTNGWGCNFALLTPFAITQFRRSRGRSRVMLGAALLASAVPAAATLNRGMFLALAVALAYTLARAAGRGNMRALVLWVVAGASSFALLRFAGVLDLVTMRTQHSPSTAGRATLYAETWSRTLESPLLGHGAPRPSRALEVSAGTQGHVWNVMFSHGLLAALFFIGVLWWLAWRTRSCTGTAYAAHICLVMVSVSITYYGYDGPQLLVALVAASLGLRQLRDRAAIPAPQAVPAPRTIRPHALRPRSA